MKDKQQRLKSPVSQIPIIGPVLHVLSLTIVVFLRKRFGYSYLQPVSIFALLALALLISTGFAWTSQQENQVWEKYKFFCFAGFTIIIFFFGRLIGCWFRQLRGSEEHEHYSGTSLFGDFQLVKTCLEPILVFAAGAYLYIHRQEHEGFAVGLWLMCAATALSIKEYWNGWYDSRQKTLRAMQLSDSEELATETKSATNHSAPPTRTTTKERPRAVATKSKPAKFDKKLRNKYSKLLGFEAPFTFENARRAYRKKVRAAHPDSSALSDDEMPDDAPEFTELKKALEFFKQHSTQ